MKNILTRALVSAFLILVPMMSHAAITLQWDPVENATGYQIWQGTSPATARYQLERYPTGITYDVSAQVSQLFLLDRGVKYTATGVALTKVTLAYGELPDQGEYACNYGSYVFSPLDAGAGVTIDYAASELAVAHEDIAAAENVTVKNPSLFYRDLAARYTTGTKAALVKYTAGVGGAHFYRADNQTGVYSFANSPAGSPIRITYVYKKPAAKKSVSITIPSTVDIQSSGSSDFLSDSGVTSHDRMKTGYTTSYGTSVLVDTNGAFTTSGVQTGDLVTNLNTGNTATLNTITSNTQLALSASIFPSGTTGHAYLIVPGSGSQTLTRVSGAPASGEYSVKRLRSGILYYTINAAQVGKAHHIRYTESNGYTLKANVPASAHSATIRNETPGTYYWRVRAVNDGGSSPYSNQVTATVAADTLATPIRVSTKGEIQKAASDTLEVGY